MTNAAVPTTPQFQPQVAAQPFGYVVLQDHEAQQRADKRRDELLVEQHNNIQATYYERLGGLLEAYPPQARAQVYATHEPLFLVPEIDLNVWLDATASADKQAAFLTEWGPRMLSVLLQVPPEGAPITDPMTGQEIQAGSRTYPMRADLYNRLTSRAMAGQAELGMVLTDWWRSLWAYNKKRCISIVRDYRRVRDA